MSPSDRDSGFVHLHNHTNFSLLDGASRIDDLIERCRELKMRSVAVTDHGNMFGAVQFYRKARAAGLKPIIGMEAYLAPGSRTERGGVRGVHENAFHQLLLARDLTGYKNLMKLSTIGYTEGFYYKPRIDKEVLERHSEGLIATTSCLSGEVPYHLTRGDEESARRALGELVEILGREDVYVELQDQGLDEQRRINPDLVRLSREFDLGLVATNDCHYLRQEDSTAHDVLLCIQTGKGINAQNRLKFPNSEFYLKSSEAMAELFSGHPEAVANTEEIARRCNVVLNFDEHHLPRFPVPDGYGLNEYFEKVVRDGLDDRMRQLEAADGGVRGMGREGVRHTLEDYEERLDHEIATIVSMGFAGYFLIVWDFMRFAREQGIPVGPGRGSAAGSLVAFALGITDVDPLSYGLFFERFLNPERVSLPDIDIDFCMRRRGEVIEYVARKYGRDKVAHIITFGTMAAKAAIRDVGRALEMSYGDVDKIARMIPNELDATIENAVETVPALHDAVNADPEVAELVELAKSLEGQVRHASTHAAGVVIADEPLTEYVPLYKPPSGQGADQEHFVATQYPMGDVERIGLLKMDFLGLRTLTLVDDTLQTISEARSEPMVRDDIPLDDGRTYELFSRGATSGIFQFESSGMRDALRKLEPSRLEDLIAMNALYRPGPLRSGMIDEYIRRRHDPEKVDYLLPELEEILRETYGVIVYQEQVMQIASELAGFGMGEADMLRKAMGKKRPEVMASMEEKFLGGCRQREVPERAAREIWDLMVEFAGYGFNKAHSAAYALLAYQTGYLKANYPVHFMAALLSSERDNTDKVVQYINECREMGIPVLPPDVNESQVSFTPVEDSIRFGLAAIKGVGETAVRAILEAREEEGSFRSLFRFCESVDLSRGINKRTVESLVKSGALDSVGEVALERDADDAGAIRAGLMAQLDRALESGQRRQRDRDLGQTNLFADASDGEAPGTLPDEPLPECEPWSERELLAGEKESLGFYITGHPLERFADVLRDHGSATTADLAEARSGREVALGVLVTGVKDLTTRHGDRMAVLRVEDLEGRAEIVVFPDVYTVCYPHLTPDRALLVRGRPEPEDETARLIATEIVPLEKVREETASRDARAVEISVNLTGLAPAIADRLRDVLESHRGDVPVSLRLERPDPEGFRALVTPNRYLWVHPSSELVDELEGLFGDGSVRVLT